MASHRGRRVRQRNARNYRNGSRSSPSRPVGEREIREERRQDAEAKERYEAIPSGREAEQGTDRRRTRYSGWGAFFPDERALLVDLSTRRSAPRYYTALRTRKTEYGKPLAMDSHRNILAEAKTFLKWSDEGRATFARTRSKRWKGPGSGDTERRSSASTRRAGGRRKRSTGGRGGNGSRGCARGAGDGYAGEGDGESGGSRSGRRGKLLWIPDSKTEAGSERCRCRICSSHIFWRSPKGRIPRQAVRPSLDGNGPGNG